MIKNFFEVATHFVNKKFPNCEGALLAGSVVRGESTDTSDLDIVILDSSIKNAYRESFMYADIPIEVFIHGETTIRGYFKSDVERARPSLPKMVSEGIFLRECDLLIKLKGEAAELLKRGPVPWGEKQIDFARYFITDLLEDFIGCTNSNELIFITGALAEKSHEFYLRTNQQWIGQSKWILRALKNFDEDFANEFATIFDEFYMTREKEKVVQLVDRILEPFGGRLLGGFSVGKNEGE